MDEEKVTYLGVGLDHIIAVGIIIVVTLVLIRVSDVFVTKIIRKSLKPDRFKSKIDEKKREETLSNISKTVVKIGLLGIAFLLILSELGVNIAPLIAGAGIFGVALGFGTQSLVKDMVSGMFILSENQYRVGDVIEVNQQISGTVETIGLRTTVLRDIDGNVHHIPNGFIDVATNKTMEFAKINMDIGVDYATDIDKLEKILNEVGVELANDDEWKDKIIEAPKFLRVNEFADSAVVVKVVGTTEPTMQWSVAGELRRRIKKAFEKNKIELPFPQRVIHQAKK